MSSNDKSNHIQTTEDIHEHGHVEDDPDYMLDDGVVVWKRIRRIKTKELETNEFSGSLLVTTTIEKTMLIVSRDSLGPNLKHFKPTEKTKSDNASLKSSLTSSEGDKSPPEPELEGKNWRMTKNLTFTKSATDL